MPKSGKWPINFLFMLASAAAGCRSAAHPDNVDGSDQKPKNSDSAAEVEDDSKADSDVDGDSDNDADADSDSLGDVDAASDNDSDSNMDADLDTGTKNESDGVTDTGDDSDMDSESDTVADSDTVNRSDTDSDSASRPLDTEPLTSSEIERLHQLGVGVGCDAVIPEEDIPLIERGVWSANPEAQQWAFLAIEKITLCEGMLDGSFVAYVFPALLDTTLGNDDGLPEVSVRAIGNLAEKTDLLTPGQIAEAVEAAQTLINGDDFENRRRGVNLLGDLMRVMDAAYTLPSFDLLLELFEAWNESTTMTYQSLYSSASTAEERFQLSAVTTFLRCCQYVNDEAQAASAFAALDDGFESGHLGISELTSMARIAARLPEAERADAVHRVIADLPSDDGWYSVTSGMYTPAHHANDALLIIEPLMTEEEILRALDAIATQEDHPDYGSVFAETVALLNARLGR